jgi:hypothetical protein
MCTKIPGVIKWYAPVLFAIMMHLYIYRLVDPDISWRHVPITRTFQLMRPSFDFSRLWTLFLNLCNILNNEEYGVWCAQKFPELSDGTYPYFLSCTRTFTDPLTRTFPGVGSRSSVHSSLWDHFLNVFNFDTYVLSLCSVLNSKQPFFVVVVDGSGISEFAENGVEPNYGSGVSSGNQAVTVTPWSWSVTLPFSGVAPFPFVSNWPCPAASL